MISAVSAVLMERVSQLKKGETSIIVCSYLPLTNLVFQGAMETMTAMMHLMRSIVKRL